MRSFSNHFQQFTAVAGIVGSVFRIGSGGKQLPEKFKISFRTVITVANQGAQGLVFLFVGSMFDQGFRPVVMAIAATLHQRTVFIKKGILTASDHFGDSGQHFTVRIISQPGQTRSPLIQLIGQLEAAVQNGEKQCVLSKTITASHIRAFFQKFTNAIPIPIPGGGNDFIVTAGIHFIHQ